MRELVLDTETTGLDPNQGHRIVEIGALELVNHVWTGEKRHYYINPDRDMPEDAFKVHGLSTEFLHDKPRFEDIAADFLDFAGDAKFVIHNAQFDMKFLNWEYTNAGYPAFGADRAIDTLAMARKRFPGAPASLDALCKRFNVDASNRQLHGALIDSILLADVYLELSGGREPGLVLGGDPRLSGPDGSGVRPDYGPRPKALAPLISDAEAAAHKHFMESLGGEDQVWSWPVAS